MQPISNSAEGYWLLTQGSQIYLKNSDVPQGKASKLNLVNQQGMSIGEYEGKTLWLVAEVTGNEIFLADLTATSLRSQLSQPEELFNLLNKGVALNHFWNSHRFCGKCSQPTRMTLPAEVAIECTACHYRTYPVICPSIIVAIRRSREILLANHNRHIDERLYTTLAGFVEVGEPLETTVRREVFEEVGISIKNIQYFASQPWSFPNSLMIGFLAEFSEGDIQLQKEEIADAQWFNCDEKLPNLPPEGTIAYKLIQETLKICREQE